MGESNPQERSEALNGYRAWAITIVMLVHARFGEGYPTWMAAWDPFIRGGVTAFMVLSGYLVTRSLLGEEERRSRMDLGSFLGGQAVRFYVPVLAYLAIALGFVAPHHPNVDYGKALRVLWLSPWTGDNWDGVTHLTGHLYSLAAQLQFFLLWPLILRAVPRERRFVVTTVLMLVAVTWRSLGREWAIQNNETLQRTDYVFGSLMVGAWWGIAVVGGRMDWMLRMTGLRLATVVAGALLVLLFTRSPSAFLELISSELRRQVAPWREIPLVATTIRWGLNLVAMIAFGCLAFLLHHGRPVRVARVFAWPGITWLGRISFSVYLWQNLFCFSASGLTLGNLRLDRFPWNLVTSVAFGYVAYRLVEVPSLRLRRWVKERLRRPASARQTPRLAPDAESGVLPPPLPPTPRDAR